MKINGTFAVQALLAANRITASYPSEPKALGDCGVERDAAHDLATLRQIVGAWASRHEVDQVTFEKGHGVVLRWRG